jgi:hypothetical protein
VAREILGATQDSGCEYAAHTPRNRTHNPPGRRGTRPAGHDGAHDGALEPGIVVHMHIHPHSHPRLDADHARTRTRQVRPGCWRKLRLCTRIACRVSACGTTVGGRGTISLGRTRAPSTIRPRRPIHPTGRDRPPHSAPIGQRLAAGLAGRAVLQRRVGERHLAHDVAALRAGGTGAPVHPHPARLASLSSAAGLPEAAATAAGQRVAQRGIQAIDRLGESGGEGEGRHPSRRAGSRRSRRCRPRQRPPGRAAAP